MRVLVGALSAAYGGGLIFLESQALALARIEDLELTVMATPAARLEGLSVARYPSLPTPARAAFEQLEVPRRAGAHDVVYMPANFAPLLARRPTVVTFQNAWHFGARARALRRALLPPGLARQVAVEARLARRSALRARRAVAVSPALADAMREDGIERVAVIASAAPADLPALPAPPGDPYVLAVGHDYFHKDWDGLAAALDAHPELPPLVVVGRPRSPARLAQLRARFPRVRFAGEVRDRAALARWYAGAAAAVAHSQLESFSLTPLEALRLGVPVAASDLPVHRAVAGLHLYPLGDPDALAAAVARAVAQGRGAPAAPSAWSWDDNARALAAELRAALR